MLFQESPFARPLFPGACKRRGLASSRIHSGASGVLRHTALVQVCTCDPLCSCACSLYPSGDCAVSPQGIHQPPIWASVLHDSVRALKSSFHRPIFSDAELKELEGTPLAAAAAAQRHGVAVRQQQHTPPSVPDLKVCPLYKLRRALRSCVLLPPGWASFSYPASAA